MKEEIQFRIDQFKDELRTGKSSAEVTEQFAVKWGISARTAARLLREAKGQLNEERNRENEIESEFERRGLEQKVQRELQQEELIDAALTKIITGVARIKKMFYTDKGLEAIEIEPDFNSIIRAASVYYRHKDKKRESLKQTEEKRVPPIIGDVIIIDPNEEEETDRELWALDHPGQPWPVKPPSPEETDLNYFRYENKDHDKLVQPELKDSEPLAGEEKAETSAPPEAVKQNPITPVQKPKSTAPPFFPKNRGYIGPAPRREGGTYTRYRQERGRE